MYLKRYRHIDNVICGWALLLTKGRSSILNKNIGLSIRNWANIVKLLCQVNGEILRTWRQLEDNTKSCMMSNCITWFGVERQSSNSRSVKCQRIKSCESDEWVRQYVTVENQKKLHIENSIPTLYCIIEVMPYVHVDMITYVELWYCCTDVSDSLLPSHCGTCIIMMSGRVGSSNLTCHISVLL